MFYRDIGLASPEPQTATGVPSACELGFSESARSTRAIMAWMFSPK
jgi:hypothetical protein